MSLFDELFADILGDSRPKSPKVAPKSPAENGSITRVIAQSPRSPALPDEKVAPLGDAPCPECDCGSFWRGDSWRCEQCTPPGDAHVATWRNVPGGTVPPTPPPAMDWPADLEALLRRVAAAFEWTRQDVADFIAWARRSPEGMADARAFLQAECEKLP